jgi:hypothetical protein
MGRLSASEENQNLADVQGTAQILSTLNTEEVLKNKPISKEDSGDVTQYGGGQVIAAKTGKKYYLPLCATAKKISEKNKIYFASAKEAERAGFTPASNCPGL